MAGILFVSADAGGNVPPMQAVARALAARGHRIAFAGLIPPDSAWEHIPLPAIAGREPGSASSGSAQLRAMMRMGLSAALGRQVGQAITRGAPDAVVVDGIMITSIRAALRQHVPVAVLFHSFGALWARMSRGPSALLALGGLSPRALWAAADARLLMTDRVLDPLTDAQNTLDFEWVGTSERGAAPLPREAGARPNVLVSLSSVWQKDQDDVYRRIIQALGGLEVRAIVTRAVPSGPYRGPIPPNVELRGRSAHDDLLPRADLVVGHGGHSTTLSALAHGVPLLVLPMNRSSDQPMIGRIVQDNGVGLTMPRSSSAAEIAAGITQILDTSRIVHAAAATGERLRTQNGALVAADRIEALAASWRRGGLGRDRDLLPCGGS